MNRNYQKTLNAYQEAGIKYTQSVANIEISDIFPFMNFLPKDGRILDVGCGGGRDLKIFYNNGFRTIGIDIVDEFIQETKVLLPGADVRKVDILDLSCFHDEFFDGIWANAVLLHLEKKDLPKALSGLYRILKKGGKLFVGLKTGQGSKLVIDKLSQKERFFSFFEPEEIKQYLLSFDFNILSFQIVEDLVGRNTHQWMYILLEKK